MANSILLAILEAGAAGCCSWGMYQTYLHNNDTLLNLVYSGLWFALGIVSNLLGITSVAYQYIEQPDQMEGSHFYLQYHYLLAWFAVIVGYPALVSSFWIVYYPNYIAHIHAALSIIPVGAWMYHQNRVIVNTTQIVSALSIVSHFYICFLASNHWGMAGAVVMIVNVISLSLPTRYNLLGFTSREAFIMGLGAASLVLSKALEEIAKHPKPVKSLIPW